MKKNLFLTLELFLFTVSVNTLIAQTTSALLFKSSFNYNVIINKTVSWNHHLAGTDTVTNFTFPDDLPGDYKEHYFNYVVGDMEHYDEYANAEIVTTEGYDGNLTTALYIEFIEDDTNFVSYSRVQYAMYGDDLSDDPVQRMNKGYVKYRIKTHFDHNDPISDWRLPIEWKDMDDDGFRMGLYVYDSNTDSPYWVAKGQYMVDGELGDDIWEFDNYDFPVIEDDWFELEVYWYGNPDPNIGKFKVAINGHVLFDITSRTKDPKHPNKMFYFMPFKVYGTVGYSWITDFEYWGSPPQNSILNDNATHTIGQQGSNLVVNQYALQQNYPNPFNPTTVIRFSIPKQSHVKLTVYNVIGEKVAELVNGNMSAGNHEVSFNASNLASGMYVYRISATSATRNFVAVKKMLLLK